MPKTETIFTNNPNLVRHYVERTRYGRAGSSEIAYKRSENREMTCHRLTNSP